MIILTQGLVAVFYFTYVSSRDFKVEYQTLPLSQSVVIKSPGYPDINYTKDTTYRWHINSFGITAAISIEIKIDIYRQSKRCSDYLQIQEINASAAKSTIFNECGKKETNITSKEHRLFIIFVSNNDSFTSKGFEVILQGIPSMKEFAYHIHLPSYKEVIIQSPGYPNKNYSKDTTYKWLVTAPYTTEEILIKIKMDIQKSPGLCEDYLRIEESNSLTGNFPIFKQCGMLEINRTTQGHRLLIKLVSNNDPLTSKGFELKLKVKKIRPTTYKSLPTTAITSQRISSEDSISVPLTTTATSTVMLSTSFDTHTAAAKERTSTKRSSLISRSSTKPTTILSTTKSFTRILKSASDVTTMVADIEGPRTTIDLSTSLDKFDDMKETTLPSQNTVLSSPTSNFFLEYKTVLVVVGLCIVELTLIIVGVLAVVKHKRRRTYNTALRQTDRNDGRLHTRQNSYKSANVYDEIELHGNDELIDDKNPYEELPEGEYDKIFQPRPHVNKGDLQE